MLKSFMKKVGSAHVNIQNDKKLLMTKKNIGDAFE